MKGRFEVGISEALDYLRRNGVPWMTPCKLRRLAESGEIIGALKPPGGHWVFDVAGLEHYVRQFRPRRKRS